MKHDIEAAVGEALGKHRAVTAIRLAGSRASRKAKALSDWDFSIEAQEFQSVAEALPALVAPLEPLAQQWDRMSSEQCYMLMLRGPAKVDLIFDEPHVPEPAWEVSAKTLAGIDAHFWDWILWLASKDKADKRDLVAAELAKMHEHLLGPLGVADVPGSIDEAIIDYRGRRAVAEKRLGVNVPKELELEVVGGLRRHGYSG